MAPPPSPPGSSEADSCLCAVLRARSQTDLDRELHRLMETATPLIRSALSRGSRHAFSAELEDVISEARAQLLRWVYRLREDQSRPSIKAGVDSVEVSDFRAYIVTLARMTAAQFGRRRHPARTMLVNRLRYLLEGHTNQRGFAVWPGPGGETWAGFEAWQDRPSPRNPSGERLGYLLADAHAVAHEVFGAGGAESSLPLADLVSGLLGWLGGPLRLRDLVDAVATWQGIHAGRGEPLGIDGEDETFASLTPSKTPSPHDELRWKEYLHWLLQAVSRLTPRQRSAFLLHSSGLREMELLGLTGIRQAAVLLEIPPEEMAAHWGRLPLEDRVIGAILGVAVQQVINLRKVARGILGRAWQNFLHEK